MLHVLLSLSDPQSRSVGTASGECSRKQRSGTDRGGDGGSARGGRRGDSPQASSHILTSSLTHVTPCPSPSINIYVLPRCLPLPPPPPPPPGDIIMDQEFRDLSDGTNPYLFPRRDDEDDDAWEKRCVGHRVDEEGNSF